MSGRGNRLVIWRGIAFTGIALAFAIPARGLRFGMPSDMGPGFVPLCVALLLLALGLLQIATGLRDAAAPLPGLAVRPMAILSVALLAFGLLLETAGLAIATVVLVVAVRAMTGERGWLVTLALALGAAAAVSLVFVRWLGLPVTIWP